MKPKSCRSPLLAGLHLPHTEPQPGPLQPHLDHWVIRTNPCVQDQIQSFQGEKIQNRLRLFRLSESFSDMENLKVTQSTNVWHLSRVENSTPPFSYFIIHTNMVFYQTEEIFFVVRSRMWAAACPVWAGTGPRWRCRSPSSTPSPPAGSTPSTPSHQPRSTTWWAEVRPVHDWSL